MVHIQNSSKPPLCCLGCEFRVTVWVEGEPSAHSEVLRALDQVFKKYFSFHLSRKLCLCERKSEMINYSMQTFQSIVVARRNSQIIHLTVCRANS